MQTLEQFIVELATQLAHQRGWSIAQATRWVETHLEEARAEYRANGAPLGDTETGFVAWLQPRPQPLTA